MHRKIQLHVTDVVVVGTVIAIGLVFGGFLFLEEHSAAKARRNRTSVCVKICEDQEATNHSGAVDE